MTETRRLHISGLTPSITPVDLERRLSSFGKVTSMDGFGARDALGDPRKFAFVTMEIGSKELARCLNALSGSTWKGAKLRIGDAKPDFRERLARFNAQPLPPARPKRTRSHNHGRPSFTLALTPLSATAATSTPGWIVTPSGRVVRPMRMRPERPLELMRGELGALEVKGARGKTKKRIKPPPVRARRRLIDPTKWDSVYLKGVFLDAVPVPAPVSTDALESRSSEGEADEDGPDSDTSSASTRPPQLVQDHARNAPSVQRSPAVALSTSLQIQEAEESIRVRDEANAALAMVSRMFGDKEDWDGRESIDEMEMVEDEEAMDVQMQELEEDDVEIVPRDFGEGNKNVKKGKRKGREASTTVVRFIPEDETGVEAAGDGDAELEHDPPDIPKATAQTVEPTPQTCLKALFAPKEDASFSLVDHLALDLDLELDTDIFGIGAPPDTSQNNHLPRPITSTPQVMEIPATKSAAKARSRVTLDPSLPLLFPLPDSLPHRYSSGPTAAPCHHNTPSCFLFPSPTRVRGLHHFPSSITFTRSPDDTPESVRERWEKDKVSLTREWKKAWREARGSRRGRGADGDIGGVY